MNTTQKNYIISETKKFIRNVLVSLATIIGFLLVMGIVILGGCELVKYLWGIETLRWIVGIATALLVLIALGWSIASENGWIKK